MYLFLTILIVIVSLFLIFFVVIQNSKGGGLAAGFSSSNQVMGVRKTTDFLEKATWYLAGTIVVLSVVSSLFLGHPAAKDSTIKDDIRNAAPVTDPNAVAPFGTPAEEGEGGQQPQLPLAPTPEQ
jgi:preprotein translocase subunit SecG